MNRKNQYGAHRKHSSAPKGAHRKDDAQPKAVSPNYQVDMLHHRLGQTQQPHSHQKPRGYQGQGGYRHTADPNRSFDKPASRPFNKPSPKHARKGYTFVSLEVKDDLYKAFTDKLKDSSKTPKEVINQLISFYNMDKINI